MIIFLKLLFGLIVLTIAGLWLVAFFIAKDIRQNFPPIGVFKTINGAKLHFIDTGQAENDDNHPVIFIHGAGGNLNDPIPMYQNQLKGKIRAIFLDRPGQGYSESFDNSNDVSVQTSSIAKLMDELNIPKAIIVGHSFGGALATSFGVLYPKKTAGLVLLAPVTHPWDTGIDWHYHLGNVPILGWVFSNTIAPIAGNFIYPGAIKRLFLPNGLPSDYE